MSRKFSCWRSPSFFLVAVVTAAATIAALTGPAAAAPGGGSDVWVSTHGDDHASGTATAPVRTVARAQQLVRQRVAHQRGDLTVHLSGGTYRLDRPLTLDQRDSGGNGHRVVWQGSGDTVLSGGDRVTGWRPVPGRPGLWQAPAPRGLDDTRQLYVNGVRAQRASGTVPVALTKTDTGYTASAPTLAGWRNPGDLEFVYTAGEALWNVVRDGLGQWTEPRCPIASVSGTTITMAQPCWDNSNKRVEFPDIPGRTVSMVGPGSLTNGAQPTYLENAFELLDQPGEWYLDRTARTVYYQPRAGEHPATADVEAPALETLVGGDGVHDVTFSGIRFEYATWLGPSSPTGFSEIQAGYQITGPTGWATQGLCRYVAGGTCPFASWTPEPANVTISHGARIGFTGDVFTHLGAAGLRLADGTSDALVRGDVFTDISGNGVELGNVDQVADTHDVTVADNHLYELAREYHGGVAVLNGYTEHDLITHNQIDHLPYSAISMGWGGWPDKIGDPATPNPSHDNTVSDNLIYDYMQLLDDGGGIYTQGLTGTSMADGEQVTGNDIHDQWGLGKNVYTDNGCTYETISGNVLYHVSYANVASRHTDYRDALGNNDPTLVTGNWWEQADPDSDNKGLVTTGNHLLTSPAAAPAPIVANAGLEPGYRHLLDLRTAPASEPEAPERVGTFAADGAVYALWSPSLFEGNSPLRSYQIIATDPAGRSTTVPLPVSTFEKQGYGVVTGLSNGVPYTVTVRAVNSGGESAISLPAAAVTPGPLAGKLAGAPTGIKARSGGTAGDYAVSLQWTPPANTGDTPVIGYRVTLSSSATGSRTVMETGRDALVSQPTAKAMIRVVDGLAAATTYTVTVAAVTADGAGAPATASVTTPAA